MKMTRKRLSDALDRSYEIERIMRRAFDRIVHEDNRFAEILGCGLRHMTLLQEDLKFCRRKTGGFADDTTP